MKHGFYTKTSDSKSSLLAWVLAFDFDFYLFTIKQFNIMNTIFTIPETQKLPTVSGNHDFLKRIHESLRKTTLALSVLFLLTLQQGFAQTTPVLPHDALYIQARHDGQGGVIKGADGIWYVWGRGAFSPGHTSFTKYFVGTGNWTSINPVNPNPEASSGWAEYLEPLTAANGFAYTGNALKVTIAQANGAQEALNSYPYTDCPGDRVVLTDDNKLWLIPFGDQPGGQNMGITVSATAGTTTIREAKLPVGILATDITYMQGSGGGSNTVSFDSQEWIMLIAKGNVYLTGNLEGQQGAATAVKDANGWQKVMINATTPLSNVKWVSYQRIGNFAAITTNNDVYVWGNGNATNGDAGGYAYYCSSTAYNFSKILPTGVLWTPYFANIAKKPSINLVNVYASHNGTMLSGLGEDGKIYRLGRIDYGAKLQGTVYTTMPTYDNTQPWNFPYNISTNPPRWQRASYDDNYMPAANGDPAGQNLNWTPEYFFDGTELTGVKFYRHKFGSAVALRDHDDFKFLYHAVFGTNGLHTSLVGGGDASNSSNASAYTRMQDNNWVTGSADYRLAYIDHAVHPGYGPDNSGGVWGLSNDGKVCVAYAKYRDLGGVAELSEMGIFGVNNNNIQNRENGNWRCGTPKKADGTPFVAAGAVTTSNTNGVGIIDCSKTQIVNAPKVSTPSTNDLVVTINVTTAGNFTPLSISGSGFSLAAGTTYISTATTGIQQFHIPVNYDGTALGSLTFTVGSAGSCTANLSTIASRPVNKLVLSLDNCAAITPGTISK